MIDNGYDMTDPNWPVDFDLESADRLVSIGAAPRARPTRWRLGDEVSNSELFCSSLSSLPGSIDELYGMFWPADFERVEHDGDSKVASGHELWILGLRGEVEFEFPVEYAQTQTVIVEPGSLWAVNFRARHIQRNVGEDPALYMVIEIEPDGAPTFPVEPEPVLVDQKGMSSSNEGDDGDADGDDWGDGDD